jgi:hypothetical protein
MGRQRRLFSSITLRNLSLGPSAVASNGSPSPTPGGDARPGDASPNGHRARLACASLEWAAAGLPLASAVAHAWVHGPALSPEEVVGHAAAPADLLGGDLVETMAQLGLLALHAAVLLAPAVVGRLRHLDDAAVICDGLAPGDQLLGGLELADDLRRCVPGAFQGRVPGPVWPAEDSHSPIHPGPLSGGHVIIAVHRKRNRCGEATAKSN